MKKWLKRLGIGILVLVGLALLYLLIIIIIGMATKYKPKPIEEIEVYDNTKNAIQISQNEEYKITTFNIGYCGLDKTQDFFMDGGKNSGGGSKEEVEENLGVISKFIDDVDSDFYILQEVDESGKRSFNVNQIEDFREKDYSSTFALNYNTKFVPVPFTRPMGSVKSGIFTMAKAVPTKSERYTFDGKPSYLVSLFELDRCFMVNRYEVENGKELVIINTHFSVFDKGGKIREKQLAQMQSILKEEYEKGNYVILGGDFNHELPGTDFKDFNDETTVEYPDWAMKMPEDFAPEGFNWAVDKEHPTVRSNNIPLREGENALLVLDGFLVSDNIEIITTEAHSELEFENSDHNAVEMKFKLK